ncbi:MAG: hypothetical protein AAGC85_13390 [Bacteroidota bacterium]
MDLQKKQKLAELFLETGKAHHQAFLDTDGDDPEWPHWYAEYLKEKLPAMLGTQMTRSKIVYELIRLDEEGLPTALDWTQVYAGKLMDKYSSS